MRAQFVTIIALACLAGSSCVPLTISREPAIDFDTYRTVGVNVDAVGYSSYLADELNEKSGFARATTNSSDGVDAILTVRVVVEFNNDSDDFTATGSFELTTPSGGRIDGGVEDSTSSLDFEAIEDVLDEISNHYLAPYNI